MPKKQHYYQVHKNKKPNKKLPKGLHPKVIKCIRLATEIVNNAIERAKMTIRLTQPIPKYKKGSDSTQVVGEVISGYRMNDEYIISVNGEKKKIYAPIDYNKLTIQEQFYKASSTLKNFGVSVEEFANSFTIPKESITKMNIVLNNLKNMKAPN